MKGILHSGKDNGQEADADTQLRWHKQVDAWKCFAALQAWHFSRANRAWSAWQQKYAPNVAAWQVQPLMWQASQSDLRSFTD